MGFQDRDYYQQRDDRQESSIPGREWVAGFTVIHYLIAINVLVWLVCIFTPVTWHEATMADGRKVIVKATPENEHLKPARYTLDDYLALRTNFIREAPWNFWQLLTYGFVHAPLPLHLVFNMIGLWIFGREVEQRLGNREFLAVYLLGIVAAGLAAVLYHNFGANLNLPKASPDTVIVGASGAISAIIMCYGYFFGSRKVRILFLPIGEVPVWSVVAVFIGVDVALQFFSRDNVAYEAHLGGFAFGYAYGAFKWNFTRWLPEKWFGGGDWFASQPDLKVYDPDDAGPLDTEFESSLEGNEGYSYHNEEADFDQEADRLLEKVHRQGAGSLTPAEREHLEEYSRRIRNKRGRWSEDDR